MSSFNIQNEDRFRSSFKVKCCDCNELDTLDAMIRKDNKKGLYHCINCETEQQIINNYDPVLFPIINQAITKTTVKISTKIKNYLLGK